MQRSRALVALLRHTGRVPELALSEWDEMLRLARSANVASRLAEAIGGDGLPASIPAPVRPHLEAALALSRHQRQAIGWEVRHIGKALERLGAPVVLLKGAAYAAAGLRAARGRLFGDVDVLVPSELLAEAEAALKLHGWIRGRIDPYDDRYYRQWTHELPPMVHNRRGTLIDVHHNILPRTARSVPPASKLLGASIPIAESPFHVLEPRDMVIHSATHLFHEGELGNGLRDLLDLEALVVEFSERSPDFVARLQDRASELGLERPVHLAFRYMAAVLGVAFPGAGVPGAARTRLGDRWLDWFYLRAFKPDHALCSDTATSLARLGLYVRGHYLRMPPLLLARHLGRKAFMRLYRNTSRSSP